jgi:hypothetical protein
LFLMHPSSQAFSAWDHVSLVAAAAVAAAVEAQRLIV